MKKKINKTKYLSTLFMSNDEIKKRIENRLKSKRLSKWEKESLLFGRKIMNVYDPKTNALFWKTFL